MNAVMDLNCAGYLQQMYVMVLRLDLNSTENVLEMNCKSNGIILEPLLELYSICELCVLQPKWNINGSLLDMYFNRGGAATIL